MQNSLLKHIFWQKFDGVLLGDCRCGLVTVGGCLVTESPIPLSWLSIESAFLNHDVEIERQKIRIRKLNTNDPKRNDAVRIFGKQYPVPFQKIGIEAYDAALDQKGVFLLKKMSTAKPGLLI